MSLDPFVFQLVGAATFAIQTISEHPLAFPLYDASRWQWYHAALWTIVILAALEALARITNLCGATCVRQRIMESGKGLAELSVTDHAFIAFNKLTTVLFTYHMLRYSWHAPFVTWRVHDLNLGSTLGALAALYLSFDLTYSLFHRALHHRSIYAYIHKHHHRQVVPSRGNTDAVNVHPFEFAVGEYNHLVVLHAVGTAGHVLVGAHIHAATVLVFVLLGGILASLNHTRLDARFPIPALDFIYQVKYHDVHHFFPPCNYGQYTMFWDWVMGTFRAHPEDVKHLPNNVWKIAQADAPAAQEGSDKRAQAETVVEKQEATAPVSATKRRGSDAGGSPKRKQVKKQQA